jgi:hypothetical protein
MKLEDENLIFSDSLFNGGSRRPPAIPPPKCESADGVSRQAGHRKALSATSPCLASQRAAQGSVDFRDGWVLQVEAWKPPR